MKYLFDSLSCFGDEDHFLQQIQFSWRRLAAAQQSYQGQWNIELCLSLHGIVQDSVIKYFPHYCVCVHVQYGFRTTLVIDLIHW